MISNCLKFQDAAGIHPQRTSTSRSVAKNPGDENSVLDNNAKAMVHSAASAPSSRKQQRWCMVDLSDPLFSRWIPTGSKFRFVIPSFKPLMTDRNSNRRILLEPLLWRQGFSMAQLLSGQRGAGALNGASGKFHRFWVKELDFRILFP